MRLEEELSCRGLLGFGSGVVWGRAWITQEEKIDHGVDGYCARECQIKQACLYHHQKKVQLIFPLAAKAFDRMVRKLGQRLAAELWRQRNPGAPWEPYLLQMMANIEDGLETAKTGKPKDRGRLTLAWTKK